MTTKDELIKQLTLERDEARAWAGYLYRIVCRLCPLVRPWETWGDALRRMAEDTELEELLRDE